MKYMYDDPVDLTQRLVRIGSSNPTLSEAKGAGEAQIADYIAAWLKDRDIEVHKLEATPGRPSIVGIVRGEGGGKSIMLNGHMDTVSLNSYATDENALSGDIDNKGRLYGRGAMDMKAGLAAAMVCLSKAKSMGEKLRGDVILTAVADEEDSSMGTAEVLSAGRRADAAIVCEPTMLDVVHAHKGYVWYQIKVLGAAAHGSRPDQGVDAILLARHVLNALDSYREQLPTHPDLDPASMHAGLIRGGDEPSSSEEL